MAQHADVKHNEILIMAIKGWELEIRKVQQRIAEAKSQLTPYESKLLNIQDESRRHRISAAGRERIAAAQRRRWAKIRRSA